MTRRVLVFAHGHPAFSPGGGEIAAYQMFERIKARPGWGATFAGRRSPAEARAPIELIEDGAFTLATSSEFFRFHNGDENFLFETLPKLIAWARPDIIHFHHYIHLGLEAIRCVRNLCPDVP